MLQSIYYRQSTVYRQICQSQNIFYVFTCKNVNIMILSIYLMTKGGEQKVGFDMNEKEVDYQLTVTKAKLESFGIITSDLEMK